MRRLSEALNAYHILTPRNPSITGTYDQPNIVPGIGKRSDPNWPLQLKSDIDRFIDGMEAIPRKIFHLLYRVEFHRKGGRHPDEAEGFTASEVAQQCGIRNMKHFNGTYWYWYYRMLVALKDWFPREYQDHVERQNRQSA